MFFEKNNISESEGVIPENFKVLTDLGSRNPRSGPMASEGTPLLGSDDESAKDDVLQEYPVYFLGMWFVGRVGKDVR